MVERQDTSGTAAAAADVRAGGTASGRRKTVVGEVTSDKMQKSIAVRVARLELHPRYHKFVRRHTTFKAHDERGEARIGDVVRIEETRPLSKTKRWRLVEVLRRAAAVRAEELAPEAGTEGE